MTTNMAGLFETVPAKDFLDFGIGDGFNPKAVTDMLNLRKAEVSRIAHVAQSSVRYDDNIPTAVRDRLEEIASICNSVAGFFNGDAHKTTLWFKTPNPMLGDVAPRDMIRLGRYDKLRKFVVNAIIEQNRDQSFAKDRQRERAAQKA
jgi:hypothetical protein